MAKILQQQIQAMSSGADDVLTDYTKIHKALLDQAKAAARAEKLPEAISKAREVVAAQMG